MAKYMAYQIYIGKITMEDAIKARPDLEEEIQRYYEEFNQDTK